MLHTFGQRPRLRRWLKRTGLLAGVAVVLLGFIVWFWGWWTPRVFIPTSVITIAGERLDSAEHDVRYRTLDKSGYVLHIVPHSESSDKGELVFFGALHSKDPNHPQLDTLRRAWEVFKPTVALVEGRMSFFVGTTNQGIRVFGEGAAVYSLAEADNIPLYTLEPPLESEIAALEECGDRTQVAMFRVLSGYMSARRSGTVSDFKIRRLLTRRAAPITDAFPSIEAFDEYFASQFPSQHSWRELPEEAMWPGRDDTILHRMATRSNAARDDHFVQVLVDLVSQGERVFAIAGRSHVVILEPVLRESMQNADYGGLSSQRPWE